MMSTVGFDLQNLRPCSADEDTTLKQIVSIDNGITLIVEKTQTFVTFWEKTYKHVWEQDKEAYIRRYEKAKKPLSSFEARGFATHL